MGWFWGKDPSSTNDPYSNLDPKLREFLDKESPLKYSDTHPDPQRSQTPPSAQSPNLYRSQIGLDAPGLTVENQDAPSRERPDVPSESLYQDGRYAHLWKNYRPQAEIEAAGRSDQDRLAEVIEAFNDRKAAIGRAAIENCVLEQMAEKDCFVNGSWGKRMKMCREENRAFNRCYVMQQRFLKALGYLSSAQTPEEEERVQMHADKLYHEMLEREARIAEAKKEGVEAPVFTPLIQGETTTQALGKESAFAKARERAAQTQAKGAQANMLSAFTPERQAEIREKVKDMSELEKEVELQLIAAESRAQMEYADRIKERLEEEKVHRAERRERGKESIGDTIKRMWGWDK